MNCQHHTADVLRGRARRARASAATGSGPTSRAAACSSLAADCLPIALARANGAEPGARAAPRGLARAARAGSSPAGVAALGGGAVAAAVGPGDRAVLLRGRRGGGGAVPRGVRRRRSSATGSSTCGRAAERALRAAGCERVDRVDLCTACHPELFFSHRRDDGRTGRQGVDWPTSAEPVRAQLRADPRRGRAAA